MYVVRLPLLCVVLPVFFIFLAGCGSTLAPLRTNPATPPAVVASPPQPSATFTATVANLPGEDLAGPCDYDLYLANPASTLRGVLVVYDRADSYLVYQDPRIRALANELDFALLFPRQCNAASFSDLQPDAQKGPGRALATALIQLAATSSHPEIADAKLVLYGFSAAGVLATTMANYMPERMIGAIAFAAASASIEENTISRSAAMQGIPFLLLSNGIDTAAGTARDKAFFDAGWAAGAPWSWGVQKNVAHCCNATTIPVIMPWIAAIDSLRLTSAGNLLAIRQTSGIFAYFTCTPDATYDWQEVEDCNFSAASVSPASAAGRHDARGWLPDAVSSEAWISWVIAPN